MRNRLEVVSNRPIHPAVFHRQKLPTNSQLVIPSGRERQSIRNKLKIVKTIDMSEEDSDIEDEKTNDKNEIGYTEPDGNFFRRNRRRRDSQGRPSGSLRLKRASGQERFDIVDMTNKSSGNGLNLKVGNDDIYAKMLGLPKRDLLNKYTINQLRGLTSQMGGPENLAAHYGMRPSEVNQVYPVKKRTDDVKRGLSPSSRIPDTPRTRTPMAKTRRPKVFTVGRKMTEKEKKMQKLIFSPIPYEVSKSPQKKLGKRASRSTIPVRSSQNRGDNELRGVKREMEDMMRLSNKRRSARRVSPKIGRVKDFDKEKYLEDKVRRSRERERMYRRRRREDDVMKYLTKSDDERY